MARKKYRLNKPIDNNPTTYRNYNKYLVLSSISLAMIAVFSLMVAIWAIRSQQDIAQKSGAFDKPNPCLYLGNHKVLPDSKTRITYGFLFNDSSIIITRLPLIIKNEGEKTLKNVIITIRYPLIANIVVPEDLIKLKIAGSIIEIQPNRKTSQLDPFEYASWNLHNINPNDTISIEEPFRLYLTKNIEGTTLSYKENKWFRYSIDYSLILNVSISGENVKTQDYTLLLHSMKSSGMEDLMHKYGIKPNERNHRIRDSNSYFDYLMLFFKQTEQEDLLIFPSLDAITINGEKNLYFSKEKRDDIKIISYYPISLK